MTDMLTWETTLDQLTVQKLQARVESAIILKQAERCLDSGRIINYTVDTKHITAQIRGSLGSHSVDISEADAKIRSNCSCPSTDAVCHHIVAVLLRYILDQQLKLAETQLHNTVEHTIVKMPENLPQTQSFLISAEKPTASSVSNSDSDRSASQSIFTILRRVASLAALFTWSVYGTEAWGKKLAAEGKAVIQTVSDRAADVDILGVDGNLFRVTIDNRDGTLTGMGFTCTCSVGRYNPRERCAHIAAALYALQIQAKRNTAVQHIQNDDPTVFWEARLIQLLGEVKNPKRQAARSILFFSLQERFAGGGWKLTPYVAPVSILGAEVEESRSRHQELLSKKGKQPQIRECFQSNQLTTHLMYSSPELNSIARTLILINQYHSESPLALVFPYLQDALVFRGETNYYGNPAAETISKIDPEPRPLQLSTLHNDSGIRLIASIPDGDTQIDLLPAKTHIICPNPLWVLVGKQLLRVAGDSAFLQGMLESRDIVIPQSERKTFIARYLPKLSDQVKLTGEIDIRRKELDTTPTCRVYLSEKKENIVVDLAFVYDDYEVPVDTNWPDSTIQYDEEREILIVLLRKARKEEAAWRALSGFGLKRDGSQFILRQRVSPIDFLMRQVPALQAAGYEVFGEEALKNARVNRNQPKLRMVVSSGIDWFDISAVVSYGELEVTLSEIRKAIKHRQGYIKLSDGSMGMLPEELTARYRHLFAMGQETEHGIRLSKTQAMLLELTLEGMDVEVDAEYSRRIERLRSFSQIKPCKLPEGFHGELRQYQRSGYDWLHFLHDYGFGGCLADDMGIGKTVQTLAFLHSLYTEDPARAASLIVMPRSLLENWEREAARFTPYLKVLIHADNSRSDDHTSFDGYHLILTTYGVMLRDLEMFRRYRFHYLVLDEAQAIKNPVSQSARAARLLNGDHRLALTGTPIENSTEELWSLFTFLNPGQLGSQEAFRTHFTSPIQNNQDEKAAQMLRSLVHPFILRRTKEQVTPELPPRTERLIYCEMSTSQRKLYLRTRDAYRAELLGLIDTGGIQQARFKVLEGLLRLRQLANDPRLIDTTFKGTSSKFEAILESLEVLREEGHKALIFSQFTSMLGLLRKSLDTRNYPYLYLDGKTKNRLQLVDRFQSDASIPFFLISLKAGGTGLNLTAADYVIHIDPWWNPAVERQATDRTHRIGQEHPVMVYKFIATDSVEEKILLLQEKKQALVEQLISTEQSFMKSLTRDDVSALFE